MVRGGLYFEGRSYTIDEIDIIGAETAAITHGHELGYIPAAAFVHIIHLVSHHDDITLLDAVLDMKEAIRKLGQGWVAEETLAIAIYCSLKYSDDFEQALIASVNHGGDSDSTGAVTGNILGAYLGLKGISKKYLDNLELKEVIFEITDDLYNDCKITEYGSCHDEIWEQKYIYKTYKPE